jgi:hypothetical protein
LDLIGVLDFLLPSSSTFMDLLPYLHTITSAAAANIPHQHVPFHRMPMPPPAARHPYPAPSAPWNRPGGGAPPARPTGVLTVAHHLPPKPSAVQLAFLRNLSTYHIRSFLETLNKDQQQAFEALQQQMKRAGAGTATQSAATLPTTEVLEEIEEIED